MRGIWSVILIVAACAVLLSAVGCGKLSEGDARKLISEEINGKQCTYKIEVPPKKPEDLDKLKCLRNKGYISGLFGTDKTEVTWIDPQIKGAGDLEDQKTREFLVAKLNFLDMVEYSVISGRQARAAFSYKLDITMAEDCIRSCETDAFKYNWQLHPGPEFTATARIGKVSGNWKVTEIQY